jgi:hypothetical protein
LRRPIFVSFHTFDLAQSDYVEIFDGASEDPQSSLRKVSGKQRPFTVVASSGSMTIIFVSDDDGESLGFAASYWVVATAWEASTVTPTAYPAGLAEAQLRPYVSPVEPAYAAPVHCAGTQRLTATTGRISDGSGSLFPYRSNARCGWIIAPVAEAAAAGSAPMIRLSFDFLDLESPYDTLIVYDGGEPDPKRVVANLTGGLATFLKTNGFVATGCMYLEFRSDASVEGSGFSAVFLAFATQSIGKGPTQAPLALMPPRPPPSAPAPAPASLPNDSTACSGSRLVETSSGRISDGPGEYLSNSFCQWLIRPGGVSSVASRKIRLTFQAVFLEARYDFVKVYDGAGDSAVLLGTVTGTYSASAFSAPWEFVGSSGQLLVVFTSDDNVQRAGFVATFLSVPMVVAASAWSSGDSDETSAAAHRAQGPDTDPRRIIGLVLGGVLMVALAGALAVLVRRKYRILVVPLPVEVEPTPRSEVAAWRRPAWTE